MSRFGGFYSGGIFSLLVWVLIALAVVWAAKKFFDSTKSGQHSYRDRNDSLEILKCRYAKGELSHEEYLKIKNTLNES